MENKDLKLKLTDDSYKILTDKHDQTSNDNNIIHGHGEYKNSTFDYTIYRYLGNDRVSINNILPDSSILELPDEINGIPVCEATLSSVIDKYKIEKIILGNNIVEIHSFTKSISSLKEVVIKSDYKGDIDSLIYIISVCVNYSKNDVIVNLNYAKNLNFVNNCILSDNDKKLLLICSKNAAIIPDSVEVIASTSFVYDFKTNGVVKWPVSLKKIEDLKFKDESFMKIFSNNPLYNNLEVLSSSTILFAINDKNFIIPKKIKDITSNAILKYNIFTKVKVNDHFSIVDDMLLNKDKTILYAYFGKKVKNILIIPKTVKEIRESAFTYKDSIKNIVLETENEILLEYFRNTFNETKTKITVKQAENKNDNISLSKKIEYINKKNKLFISNDVKLDKLIVDIEQFLDTGKKVFVLTKECANIKELIIPEGVTDVQIDNSCFSVIFNTEIIELPSTCKFMPLLNQLSEFINLMMLVINPDKKPKWTVHNVPFIIACKNNISMPKGVKEDHTTFIEYYSGATNYVLNLNEITYIKNYDNSRLVTTDEAYYYINNLSKNELGLLKVKRIEKFSNPKKIGDYKVTKEHDFCYSKYNLYNIEINNKIN